MVPDQMWIEEECKYDIAAMYGISHWWFQRQRFYIDRHTSEGDRSAVRTHMRILSVVRIEVFSMYGYDYIKKIVLHRADLNECTSTPTESSCHDESSSLYAELGLTDSEVESDEDVPGIDTEVQDKGQAGPNPGEQDEGHAGTNPGDAVSSQPQSSPVVHARPNLEHTDLEATYVILEEPASSTGTLSSLQYLAKDLNFSDLLFNDKPSEVDNEKITAETKAESMVSITIQQDTSSIPPMTTPIINLTPRPDSPNVHWLLQATATETTTTTTTTHPPPPQPQQSTTDSMLKKCIGELKQIMANLIKDNKYLEKSSTLESLQRLPEADIKEILHKQIWETNSYKAHEDHMILYEALEKSMNRDHTDELLKDLAKARRKKKKRRDSPKTPPGSPPYQPPPPPPPASLSRTSGSSRAFGSSQTDTRLRPSVSSTPEDLHMDDDMALDAQVHSSDDEDIRNAYIPKYQIEECHKLLTDSADDSIIRHNVSKPLPLGGPPSQVIIQSDIFFNKDLEYLRYGSQGNRPALAAYYPDVGLEQIVTPSDGAWTEYVSGGVTLLHISSTKHKERHLKVVTQIVLDQMWIEDEYTSEGDRRAVRTHMWILSVVRIEVFSMYRYDYMKKIVLHRADLNEHVIAERDFKYLYLSDFEDLYLLNLQGFEYTHDYTVIDSPRAITFREKYEVQMIMRFNKIHKFSDDTLHQIDEALDYQVKEFKTMRIFRNLESFVGGRVRDGDYRILKRTE
nr:hypothetical protein [Tanacetum cinerariifolium]